jgi:hypothetical protein
MLKKNFMNEVILALIFSVFLILCGCASDVSNDEPLPLPGGAVGQVTSVTATVADIDYKTRRVTLKMPDGKTVPVTVSEAAYNFDQVKAGDLVDIAYTQCIAILLEKDTGQAPVSASSGLERAPKGQKPQGVAYTTMDVRAKVVAIDYTKRTADLSGPDGKIFPVTVDNSVPFFENIKVGDDVVARYTEAIAISVRPATPLSK